MKDVTDSIKSSNKTKNWKKIKAIKKSLLKNIRWLYLILFIILAIYYYIILPPIHYASIDFWLFLLIASVGIILVELLADGFNFFKGNHNNKSFRSIRVSPKYKGIIQAWLLIFVLGTISYGVLSPFLFSKKYSQMITYETANFKENFPETNVNQIPLVDRDTAERLGNRHLGALTDLVSQFEAASDYTQINIKGYPYRITPLEYADFFRWLNNFREGIPHYIQVDNVTGEVEIKTPEKPIKYSYSDKFNRNIMRHLRFRYPFTLFENPTFEVDDEGVPYYIATTYTRNFLIREPEVAGVITVNAMTGETEKYELDSIPTWIDRVYSAKLIMHQLKMNGLYKNGYWNSLFAKKGVTEPSEGYNYLPMKDDLYLYTGITSVAADDSNIGFMLVNMRTKETEFYPLTAAEEFSAMRSAEGSVQETEYQATFPLLINIKGRPMYILTLKDNSGLIKAYALVDVQNYQRVYVEATLEKLLQKYSEEFEVDTEEIEALSDLKMLEGKIEDIQATVVEGQTVYYFMVDGTIYKAPISLSDQLPFIKQNDSIQFSVNDKLEVKEIELKKKSSSDDKEEKDEQDSENEEVESDKNVESINESSSEQE